MATYSDYAQRQLDQASGRDMDRQAKCRYCKQGHKANDKGEHWIVKSVFPARIDIRKCTDFHAA